MLTSTPAAVSGLTALSATTVYVAMKLLHWSAETHEASGLCTTLSVLGQEFALIIASVHFVKATVAIDTLGMVMSSVAVMSSCITVPAFAHRGSVMSTPARECTLFVLIAAVTVGTSVSDCNTYGAATESARATVLPLPARSVN
jgi:hypothetical protein